MNSALIRAAVRGELPAWTEAGTERRSHMARVATLLGEWAAALGLAESEQGQWRATGYLHDALRDAAPAQLRRDLLPPFRWWADPLLHGPAAANRLAAEAPENLCLAIRFHTVGHPALDRLGCALYLADYLEPGRNHHREQLAALRGRMPGEFEAVLREVVAARIAHALERRRPIHRETAAFWTSLVARPA